MCFSATVSFTAGATLTIVGLLSLSYAQQLKQRMLAVIPLCFGIQQIAEGMVWKGMEQGNEMLIGYGTYAFLFFAFFYWPVWVPLTMYTITDDEKRRVVLKLLMVMGAILGGYLINYMATQGVSVRVVNCHIMYALNSLPHHMQLVGMITYLIVTIVPFFIVLNPLINVMGATIAASYLISHFFYAQVLISVWCFFAAIISFFSIFIMYDFQKTTRRKKR